MIRLAPAVGLSLAVVLAPQPAHAHLVDARFGDFYGGLLHVLTGLQYVFLLIALSVLAALQPRETARWMLAAAPLGMLIGGALAVFASVASISIAVTVSLGIVSVLVALGQRLPAAALAAIGAVSTVILGFENGLAMTAQSTVYLFVSGLTAAAFLVVTLVTAGMVHLAARGNWARIALRAGGSWLAAISMILLALAVAGPVQAG